MTIAARPQPAPPKTTCDAPVKGGRCGRPACRQYRDSDDATRGFCWLAEHATKTKNAYPPKGNEERVR